MATLSGAERIRAITDEDGMFKAFDTYPWKKDKAFISGLNAILGDPNTENPKEPPPTSPSTPGSSTTPSASASPSTSRGLAREAPGLHAPRHSAEEYKSRSTQDTATTSTAAGSGDAASANDVPGLTSKLNDLSTGKEKDESADAATTETAPSWQAAAPKADLYVERKPPSQADAPGQGGDEPAYPMGFAQMLDMIQKGIPIPGIRQIPDTVVRDASVKPFGKRAVPKKPWEKDLPAAEPATDEAEKPSVVDAEFPPLDEVAAPVAETATKET
ncbi:LOW QUALITY PROTEIN: hypothetical protein Ct61P_04888 [Colletotrichum tofieldiae]|nr:LOW QUALITY PROTEIN: hypothetical protein Ct61P_04888 [Colletotrichum tofieldiae]